MTDWWDYLKPSDYVVFGEPDFPNDQLILSIDLGGGNPPHWARLWWMDFHRWRKAASPATRQPPSRTP